MATLSVLKFNDPGGADRVLIALEGLQERPMITLEDAAVVSWPQGVVFASTGDQGSE
jgi:uncharacterized membrane protein